jgi:hypothetical protein
LHAEKWTCGIGSGLKTVNDELYFTNTSGLYKIGPDGKAELVLSSQYIPENCVISDISENKAWAAFYKSGDDESDRGYLYVVNLIDHQTKLITDADTIGPAYLIGDFVYYYKDYDYENGPVYSLRTRFK